MPLEAALTERWRDRVGRIEQKSPGAAIDRWADGNAGSFWQSVHQRTHILCIEMRQVRGQDQKPARADPCSPSHTLSQGSIERPSIGDRLDTEGFGQAMLWSRQSDSVYDPRVTQGCDRPLRERNGKPRSILLVETGREPTLGLREPLERYDGDDQLRPRAKARAISPDTPSPFGGIIPRPIISGPEQRRSLRLRASPGQHRRA
jgi:hypothetical protein